MNDGTGATATATVNITVNAVNDAPVAGDDAATVSEGGSVTTVNVLGNDSDVDDTLHGGEHSSFSQGTNGTVVNNADGTFTYTQTARPRPTASPTRSATARADRHRDGATSRSMR